MGAHAATDRMPVLTTGMRGAILTRDPLTGDRVVIMTSRPSVPSPRKA